MSDKIPKPHDPYPGNLWSVGAFLVGKLSRRLADHDEVVEDGVARLPIELARSDMAPDRLDSIDDVPKPQSLAPAQSGTASAIASSRTSGRSDLGATTSTRAPTRLVNSSESSRASSSSAPEERSPYSSTIRSISLASSSSPRAIEPKIRTFRTPRVERSSRIASRCKRSRSEREPTTTMMPARPAGNRTLLGSWDRTGQIFDRLRAKNGEPRGALSIRT